MQNEAWTIISGRRVMPIQRGPDADDLAAVPPAGHQGTRNGYAARSRVRVMNRVTELPTQPPAADRSGRRPDDEVFIRMCACSTQ